MANNFRLKGLAVLLKAMASAAKNDARWPSCLIVIGAGKSYKYHLMAKKLELERKIVFLHPVRQIQNILSVIDVAVLPTFYDPSSRFILEALAAGKPVITTRFNGATDLFVNNRHGKVIDSPEDVSSLAEAINYFTDTNNIRQASDAIVVDNLKEKVSMSRVVRELVSVYESILQRKGLT